MTLAWLSLLILWFAEPPIKPPPVDSVQLTKSQYLELKAAADRVDGLESRLTGLLQRIEFLEERAGVRPVSERTLKRAIGLGRVQFPGKVRLITDLGDSGRKRDLGAVIRSQRATVVTWWATWCKPCTSPEELRHLARLKTTLDRYGLKLVSLAVDDVPTVRNDSRAATWVYPYWQLKDGHLDVLPETMLRSGGVGLPLFLIIDGAGQIRWIRKQALTNRAVDDLVSAAVNLTTRH